MPGAFAERASHGMVKSVTRIDGGCGLEVVEAVAIVVNVRVSVEIDPLLLWKLLRIILHLLRQLSIKHTR